MRAILAPLASLIDPHAPPPSPFPVRLRLVLRYPAFSVLAVLYAIFSLLPYLLTYVGMHRGGSEMNPISAHLFESYPFVVAAAMQLLISAAFLACVTAIGTLWPTWWWRRIACVGLALMVGIHLGDTLNDVYAIILPLIGF